MEAPTAFKIVEVFLDQVLKEITIESRFLVDQAVSMYEQQGRGAFYCDVPFKTLTSCEQLAHLVYLTADIVNTMEYSPVTEMLQSYNPMCECVVLARVGFPEVHRRADITRRESTWDAYLKSQVMSHNAYLTISSSVKHAVARVNHAMEITKPCSSCGKHDTVKLLKRCGRCQSASYCGASCQRADWPAHKPFCSMMTGVKDSIVDMFCKKK